MTRTPTRIDGYAPLRDYAAIGNKRTAALVALDGAIDWFAHPRFDQPPAFCSILDARAGGRMELGPAEPFTVERRYLPETNVLETTFRTAEGAVRVTDAVALGRDGPPWNEILRRVEGLAGSVRLRWRVDPRFNWGDLRPSAEHRRGVPVLAAHPHAVAVQAHEAGEAAPDPRGGLSATVDIGEGDRGLVAISAFDRQPLTFTDRDGLERRLDETAAHWRRWARTCRYEGPWREAVVRSALALDLCIDSRSGAIVAAPTSSLPEALGGSRNWDYRYAWVRDAVFTLEAMIRLGFREQVHGSLAWLLDVTGKTHPRLRPFYGLDGGTVAEQRQLGLEGYRGSAPVVTGNSAGTQLQLGAYGYLLETAWLYVDEGGSLDPESARRLAEAADFVCRVWDHEDSGIWELPETRHYTQSKLACWLALDRAVRLAERGELPDEGVAAWRRTMDEIRAFVDERCWSREDGAYRWAAGEDGLDAGVLIAARAGYVDPRDPRLRSTIDRIRAELGRGPLVHRYSRMRGEEGAFVACSFWLVEALARSDRLEEAEELMDEMLGLANDVGLFSEQIDPGSGEFLGNFPQALSHLSLVNAAHFVRDARARRN